MDARALHHRRKHVLILVFTSLLSIFLVLALSAWMKILAASELVSAMASSDPESKIVLISSTHHIVARPWHMSIAGNLMYASDGSSLRIVDVSEPTSPTLLSAVAVLSSTALTDISNVEVSGTLAYLASWDNGLLIVDTTNPLSPTLLSRYLGGHTSIVRIVGSLAYIAKSYCCWPAPIHTSFQILDVSNPISPTFRGEYDFEGSDRADDLEIRDNTAYLSIDNEIRIIDVSNPLSPTLIGGFALPRNNPYLHSGTIEIVGNLLYASTTGSNEFQIIDISDSFSPTLLSKYHMPSPGSLFEVQSSLAYIDWWGPCVSPSRVGCELSEKNLWVLDVHDPHAPFLRGASKSLESYYEPSVAAQGNIIYRGRGIGLDILRLLPPPTVTVPTSGGVLYALDDATEYQFPSGTFTDTVLITHTTRFRYDTPPADNLFNIGHGFAVAGTHLTANEPVQPAQPYTITVRYTDEERYGAVENSLALYYWNGIQWVKEASSRVDPVARVVTATPTDFALWAVLGETQRIFLPLVQR